MGKREVDGYSAYLPWHRQPIVYAFISLLVLTSIISLISYRELMVLRNQRAEVYEVPMAKIQLLDSMVHHSRQRQVLLRDIAISTDPFEQDALIQEHHAQARRYLEARNRLVELVGDGDEAGHLQQLVRYNNEGYETQLRILELSFEGRTDEALQLLNDELAPNRERIYPLMLFVRDLLVARYTEALRGDERSFREAGERIAWLYVIAILLGAFLAVSAYRIQRRHHRAMAWQATHDTLTGLANRFHFESAVSRAVQQEGAPGPFALLYVDLDQFKLVNDTAGHGAGDELLRQVSALLSESLPDNADLARIGGDEFSVLLPNTNLRDARALAEVLLRRLSDKQFIWVGHIFRISASIGILIFDAGEKTVHELLSAADIALHAAKDSGRNRYHVYASHDSETTTRLEEMRWASRLGETLSRERIKLHHQPIVRSRDRVVDRSEILIRYLDANGRLHSGYRLVGAAEKYGFAAILDLHVIGRVLEFMRSRAGAGNVFNINLSGHTLDSKDALKKIVSLIDSSRIDPARLCFEITETAAITHFTNAAVFIRTLKGMGCGFALDDFGTGVSSFGYLERLPVDMIKIDSGFIRNIPNDKTSRAIVLAIREVAGVFGASLVAEGVENDQLRAVVTEMGIEYLQGFGIAEPAPLIRES